MPKLKIHFNGNNLISNDKTEYSSFEISKLENGKRRVLLSGKPAALMLILNYGMKAVEAELDNTIVVSSDPVN